MLDGTIRNHLNTRPRKENSARPIAPAIGRKHTHTHTHGIVPSVPVPIDSKARDRHPVQENASRECVQSRWHSRASALSLPIVWLPSAGWPGLTPASSSSSTNRCSRGGPFSDEAVGFRDFKALHRCIATCMLAALCFIYFQNGNTETGSVDKGERGKRAETNNS